MVELIARVVDLAGAARFVELNEIYHVELSKLQDCISATDHMDAHLALMVESWAAIINSFWDSPNEP